MNVRSVFPLDLTRAVARISLSHLHEHGPSGASLRLSRGIGGATLDVDAMNEACSHLIGEHDFKSFCMAASAVGKPTHRDVMELSVCPEVIAGTEVVTIRVVATRFCIPWCARWLEHLWRSAGSKSPAWVGDAGGVRQAGGMQNAPAAGLVFWSLNSPEDMQPFWVNRATRESTIFPMHIVLLAGSAFVRFCMVLSGDDFFLRSRALLIVRAAFLKHWHISFLECGTKAVVLWCIVPSTRKPDSWKVFRKLILEYRLEVFLLHATPRARVQLISIEERTRHATCPAPYARGRNLVRNYKITCNRQAFAFVICSRFLPRLVWACGASLFGGEIRRRHVFAHVLRFRVHHWLGVAAA